jgi:hypothetical protein
MNEWTGPLADRDHIDSEVDYGTTLRCDPMDRPSQPWKPTAMR